MLMSPPDCSASMNAVTARLERLHERTSARPGDSPQVVDQLSLRHS
eukprot:CAMPEP_0114015638 /NCGR_PEP_ID=MMETSP0372-20130328/12801_1 /TAXON_ID=340204 /ORGANISM="Lankesteria abbotti" /LENGTH=45 /assembly_acc=CAM_ASM_000359